MSRADVIRAWKDAAYRLSLSEAERALLPDHPAELIALSEADLDAVAGGGEQTITVAGELCC
jgi:mersacidin/lichenicidin family type 2 lantibiotic